MITTAPATTRRRRNVYCRRSKPSELPLDRIVVGDALERLRKMPTASIDTVVTSPPYFLLRNYEAGPSEVGTEDTVHGYVKRLVAVMDEVARVLKPTGSVWLNIGDSYSRGDRYGAPAKSLLLAPERVALALCERGWIVRNRVAWTKPNPMPASVADRLTAAWEHLYFLTRRPRYYFDLDVIRRPHTSTRTPQQTARPAKYGGKRPAWAGPLAGANDGLDRAHAEGRAGHPLGKNPTDHWHLATAGFRGAHFAVYPEALITPPILATCPQRVCRSCGAAWQRNCRRDRLGELQVSCGHHSGWRAGVVLDPFMGAGTTGVVAARHRRHFIGIELNAEYAALARQRISSERARASPDAVNNQTALNQRKENTT
jgi:site-specific DNA-methyltransferase (adenine-specific)